MMDSFLSLAEFRASRNLTSRQLANLVKIGAGPVVSMQGRKQIVTHEAALAFDRAMSERIVSALSSAAKLSSDNPEAEVLNG